MDISNATLKAKVCRCRPFIVQQVNYAEICDMLRVDVFDLSDHEYIRDTTPVNVERMSRCLDRLELREPEKPNAYQEFLASLEDTYPHVKAAILSTQIPAVVPVAAADIGAGNRIPLQGEASTRALFKVRDSSIVMQNWETLARQLGVGEAEIMNIKHANRDNLREQVYQMLLQWQGQNSRRDATNRALALALINTNMRRAAEDIFELDGTL